MRAHRNRVTIKAETLTRSAVYAGPGRELTARGTEHSPCAVCGGIATGNCWWGPWRRHRRCGSLSSRGARAAAACRAYGLTIEPGDGDLIALNVAPFHETHQPVWPPGAHGRGPWRHIDREALAAEVALLPARRAQAGRSVATCTLGRCGWCGRSESRVWTAHGHRWADGADAALCEACSAVYVRHGEPPAAQWELQREALAEALTSMVVMGGEHIPDGVQGLAEVGEEHGDGEPWSHLPAEAVESYRWSRWTRFPGYAPPEHREEARRRAAEADAARQAGVAAKLAEKATMDDVHGFGGAR